MDLAIVMPLLNVDVTTSKRTLEYLKYIELSKFIAVPIQKYSRNIKFYNDLCFYYHNNIITLPYNITTIAEVFDYCLDIISSSSNVLFLHHDLNFYHREFYITCNLDKLEYFNFYTLIEELYSMLNHNSKIYMSGLVDKKTACSYTTPHLYNKRFSNVIMCKKSLLKDYKFTWRYPYYSTEQLILKTLNDGLTNIMLTNFIYDFANTPVYNVKQIPLRDRAAIALSNDYPDVVKLKDKKPILYLKKAFGR